MGETEVFNIRTTALVSYFLLIDFFVAQHHVVFHY